MSEEEAVTESPEPSPTTKNWWSYLVAALMLLSLSGLLLMPTAREFTNDTWRAYWSLTIDQWWWLVPTSFGLLMCMVCIDNRLRRLNWRWLEWSLLKQKMNVATMPITMKGMGLPYVLILAYCLPLMALVEEMLFRYTTDHWLVPTGSYGGWRWLALLTAGLLWSGLVFGLAHLGSFVSIRMALCLSFAGVVMFAVYMARDITAAMAYHATYNGLALCWIMFEVQGKPLLQRMLNNDARRAHLERHLPTITIWADKLVQANN